MESGRAGTDHSAMMDLGPDQPLGSSGAVIRGERSPSWGRWVSEGQVVSLGVRGLVIEGVEENPNALL